jgi:hypothetical protein
MSIFLREMRSGTGSGGSESRLKNAQNSYNDDDLQHRHLMMLIFSSHLEGDEDNM